MVRIFIHGYRIKNMTKKEYILDSLINDDEALTQIIEYFKFVEVNISYKELNSLLAEMLEEGYITVNYTWKNENDEYPYSLTKKGIDAWNNIEEFKDISES